MRSFSGAFYGRLPCCTRGRPCSAEALRQARSPSRRQHPVATEVLEAPTVRRVSESRLLHHRRAWLGIVGGMAVAVTVVALQRERYLSAPGPMRPMAPQTLAAASPAGAVPAATMPPAETAPATLAPAPTVTPAPTVLPRSLRSVLPAPARAAPAPSPRPTVFATAAPVPTAAATPIAAATPPLRTEPPEPQGNGLLLVVARPWGSVRIDGNGMGTTPLDTIPLKSGPHTVASSTRPTSPSNGG